jgi:hypothetical protein
VLRNWLVEHLDGHDVLSIGKCKWAKPRSASEQVEVEGAVADFWSRTTRSSGQFRDDVDAKGPAGLLEQCRAAVGEKAESVAGRIAKTERRQRQHLQDVERLRGAAAP